MTFFIFITAYVLMAGLSVAMLTFILGVLINKYKRYLQSIVLVTVILFAVLLLIDLFIYRSCISVINEPPRDSVVIDFHPFPSMITFSLNWHVPFMVFMVFITLILTRNTKKNVYFWVALAIAVLPVCGPERLSRGRNWCDVLHPT
ncbi:MAG: hypothetical protein ACYSWZ_26020 [Planctomycetota bacterium]|jgi:4-amino-4-deoxy-L-arabinose transferase-like glycosyltransferase